MIDVYIIPLTGGPPWVVEMVSAIVCILIIVWTFRGPRKR